MRTELLSASSFRILIISLLIIWTIISRTNQSDIQHPSLVNMLIVIITSSVIKKLSSHRVSALQPLKTYTRVIVREIMPPSPDQHRRQSQRQRDNPIQPEIPRDDPRLRPTVIRQIEEVRPEQTLHSQISAIVRHPNSNRVEH
jgi:hypothetical protein